MNAQQVFQQMYYDNDIDAAPTRQKMGRNTKMKDEDGPRNKKKRSWIREDKRNKFKDTDD